MEELKTMSEAVRKVIEDYPAGHQFHGNQLHDDVAMLYTPARTMYTDTLMRMMRRHCSHQYITVDQNKSLYEKKEYRTIVKQPEKTAPEIEKKPVIPTGVLKQGELPLFSHGFLVFFLVVFFGLTLGLETGFASTFGRPLVPPSRMASRSGLKYTPAVPMNMKGSLSNLCSLLFTASDDILNSWDMLKTVKISILTRVLQEGQISVYPSISIYISLRQNHYINQVGNGKNVQTFRLFTMQMYSKKTVKMSKLLDIFLYISIVKNQKIYDFSEISSKNLDYPPGLVYSINVQTFGQLRKQTPVIPEAERHPIGAEGEFYERTGNRVKT